MIRIITTHWVIVVVMDYHYSLRNNPEQHSVHLLRGGSKNPHTHTHIQTQIYIYIYIYIYPDLQVLCVSVVSRLAIHRGEEGSVCDREETGHLSLLNE